MSSVYNLPAQNQIAKKLRKSESCLRKFIAHQMFFNQLRRSSNLADHSILNDRNKEDEADEALGFYEALVKE